MKRLNFLLLLYTFFFFSCVKNVSTSPYKATVEQTFLALMDETIIGSHDYIAGVSMSIISPKLEQNWSGTRGFDSDKKLDSLSINQPFRIASITKTFVAAAILRLHELQKISIDDTIDKYISTKHKNILVLGGYEPSKIKIKHCLNHTSGLFDYAVGKGTQYIKICKQSPTKRWTRTEQLQGAMNWGEKIGHPGERYGYSDTGYIILGEIIEYFFDKNLALGLRTLLKFDALGLKRTWLESLEPPKDTIDMVHRYLKNEDVSNWDNSIDLYGGGGLASTCNDLTIFIHALFNGQIFEQEATLGLMLEKPKYASTYDFKNDKRYKDYRAGLWEINIYGEKAYLHKGLWGTIVLHIPAYNSSFSVNFTKGWSDRLMKKTILVIKNIEQ